jgi:hypothetical protein
MKKTKIRRIFYLLKHDYLTVNTAVIVFGLIIASAWVGGSLQMMQRNYNLQKQLDDKQRQLIVAQLDTENAQLEQRFFKTDEYKELAVRERLGLALSGESVLILPPNSLAVKESSAKPTSTVTDSITIESNFTQWLNFLFGSNSNNLSDSGLQK